MEDFQRIIFPYWFLGFIWVKSVLSVLGDRDGVPEVNKQKEQKEMYNQEEIQRKRWQLAQKNKQVSEHFCTWVSLVSLFKNSKQLNKDGWSKCLFIHSSLSPLQIINKRNYQKNNILNEIRKWPPPFLMGLILFHDLPHQVLPHQVLPSMMSTFQVIQILH